MAIYIWCSSIDREIGGIKQGYQHVNVLNKNGIPSYIYHEEEGFRCSWFRNDTPICYHKEYISENDIVVFPEFSVPFVPQKFQVRNKVIFNQGCYHTFNNLPLPAVLLRNKLSSYYHKEEVKAVLVVSENDRSYLKHCFPDKNIYRIKHGIDSSLFYFDKAAKKKQIAFMCTKNPHDIRQIIYMLKIRDALKGWELTPIYEKPHKEVARILREASIFLSFGTQEGFYLPAAEAMACGCIVIGYNGLAGREYFQPDFSYTISNGDVLQFALVVERAIEQFNKSNDIFMEKSIKASNYIQKNYSLDKEEKSIVEAWNQILSLINVRDSYAHSYSHPSSPFQ